MLKSKQKERKIRHLIPTQIRNEIRTEVTFYLLSEIYFLLKAKNYCHFFDFYFVSDFFELELEELLELLEDEELLLLRL